MVFLPMLLLAAVPQAPLAEEVAESIRRGGERSGEWGLVEDQMAILGLGQIVLEHPETRAHWLPVMDLAAEHLLRPSRRAFATQQWGSDGFAHLDEARGDAWLGWIDLALSMLRRVDPQTRFARVNDEITEALARRLTRAPHALIETYPHQSFPTDVAACAAAIALHDQATGTPRPMLSGWAAQFRSAWIDPQSGYLWQRGDAKTGAHRDAPRGSGTAVSAYFLSFSHPDLSRDLGLALERHQRALFGYAAISEYPAGYDGSGDVDSGPVVLGTSVVATGFSLGAARANGLQDLYERLLKTTRLFGVPLEEGGRERYWAGGSLGNAILLAQLTTPLR